MLLHQITDQSLSVLSRLLRCWKYLRVNDQHLFVLVPCNVDAHCGTGGLSCVPQQMHPRYHPRCARLCSQFSLHGRGSGSAGCLTEWGRVQSFIIHLCCEKNDGKITFWFYSSALASSQQKSFCWIVLEKTNKKIINPNQIQIQIQFM